MKSAVRLTQELIKWGSCVCCACTYAADIMTVDKRHVKEGARFLTLTLPQFAKDLEQALHEGAIGPNLFRGFKRKGMVPVFLGGHMDRLFFTNGSIRTDVPMDEMARHIGVIRQICLFHSKLELPSTPQQVDECLRGYISTDVAIPDSVPDIVSFKAAAKRYLWRFFNDVAEVVLSGDFKPGHASGALATRESYNARFESNVWTERLQRVLPYWDVLCCNWRDSSSQSFSVLSEEQETPARVTTVPKNAKGPRIIAMEPVYNQYVQQGILSAMTTVLSRPEHRALFLELCWVDQGYNRDLARIGSADGSYATLDLSEASDRVSLDLVRALPLGSYLEEVILAARSTRATLPSGEMIELRKFASMGSSLCFPMETFVFYTIARMTSESLGLYEPPHRKEGIPSMRVYGDDIIVPVDSAQLLVTKLESFGLKVNASKSFWSGNFRESCGADWFGGYSVSVVRNRKPFPTSSDRYDEITSVIDLHNRLYEIGVTGACEYIRQEVEKLSVFVPRVPRDCVGIGFHAEAGEETRLRFNKSLFRLESRALARVERKPADPLNGYGALRKFFANADNMPRDVDHLINDGRSQCVSMNTGWAAVR